MTIPSPYLDALRNAILKPTRAILGVVDDVLELCRAHELCVDWRGEILRVSRLGADSEDVVEAPLRKSVFRAVLARVAALCDAQAPGKCSPYGGQGDLRDGSRPGVVLHCAWVNTLGEQKLTITPIRLEANQGIPTAVQSASHSAVGMVEPQS